MPLPSPPRRIRSERSSEPILFSSATPRSSDLVSLRPFKSSIQYLPPTHPLRILLAGEPDEIPTAEFAVKMVGWHRLLRLPVG
jgi:hypothetical protein